MEYIAVLAGLVIVWMLWQLKRAKDFNQFKRMLHRDFKAKVQQAIKQQLINERSSFYPNTDCHISACQYFWGQYAIRILQAGLAYNIITEQWLKQTCNWRNSQHLFHTQQQWLANSDWLNKKTATDSTQ